MVVVGLINKINLTKINKINDFAVKCMGDTRKQRRRTNNMFLCIINLSSFEALSNIVTFTYKFDMIY